MRMMISWILSVMLVAPAAAAQEAVPPAVDGVTSPSRRNLRIVIADEVFNELGLLADTSRVETVRCLIGLTHGDSIFIDLAWQPPVLQSRPHSVAYRPCPVATIVLWHNHPGTRDAEPEYSCYLSRVDIREAIRSWAPRFQMVQVTGAVACWWTRTQVEAHADAPLMRPLARQSRGRFHLWSAVTCSSESGRVVCSRPASYALGTGARIRR